MTEAAIAVRGEYQWNLQSIRAKVWRAIYASGPAGCRLADLRAEVAHTTDQYLNQTTFRLREFGQVRSIGWGHVCVDETCIKPSLPDALLAQLVLPDAFMARAMAWLEDMEGGVDSDVLAPLMMLPHVVTMEHMAELVTAGLVRQVVNEAKLNIRYTLASRWQP